MATRRFLAILNPVSGRRNMLPLVRQVGRLLERRRARLDIAVTDRAGHAAELAARVDPDVEALLVVGGDGTVCEVVNGLDGRKVPMVIFRTGTENLLARELHMPLDPRRVADAMLHGRPIAIDAGLVNDRQRFLAVAGVGFDAECVLRMSRTRGGHITHADYFWPIWRTFWSYRFPTLDIHIDGKRIFAGRGFAILGVIPRYSVGMRILHRARVDDGRLDLAVFPCESKIRLVTHAVRILTRMNVDRRDASYHQFRELRIESPDRVPYELDGERGGFLPFHCRVQPGAAVFLRNDADAAYG